eukprot:g3531.t1
MMWAATNAKPTSRRIVRLCFLVALLFASLAMGQRAVRGRGDLVPKGEKQSKKNRGKKNRGKNIRQLSPTVTTTKTTSTASSSTSTSTIVSTYTELQIRCTVYGDCGSCIVDESCGWLLDDVEKSTLHQGACVPGSATGPSTANSTEGRESAEELNNRMHDFDYKRWDYNVCPALDCGGYVGCSSCIADPVCGWCAESGKCVAGDESGPTFSAASETEGCPKGFIHSPASRAVPHEMRGVFALMRSGGSVDMKDSMYKKDESNERLEALCAAPDDPEARRAAEIAMRPAPQDVNLNAVYQPNPEDRPEDRAMADLAREMYDPPLPYRHRTCAPCIGVYPNCDCSPREDEGDVLGPTGVGGGVDNAFFGSTGGYEEEEDDFEIPTLPEASTGGATGSENADIGEETASSVNEFAHAAVDYARLIQALKEATLAGNGLEKERILEKLARVKIALIATSNQSTAAIESEKVPPPLVSKASGIAKKVSEAALDLATGKGNANQGSLASGIIELVGLPQKKSNASAVADRTEQSEV